MEENLKQWIDRVSKPRKELNGFSICPFAKKSSEEQGIFWTYIEDHPEAFMLRYLQILPVFNLVVFIDKTKTLTNGDLLCIMSNLQEVMPELIFLKDHPDYPGYINGVSTGNGVYPIILAQPRYKLLESRERLKKTKYYDYWSEEYKNEVWSYGSESKSD